jgi:hypothetical protein
MFSPATKQVSSAQKQRHALPKDLPNAVKHLGDQELHLLITACLEEAKRRGRFAPQQSDHEQVATREQISPRTAGGSGHGFVDAWAGPCHSCSICEESVGVRHHEAKGNVSV